MKFAKNPYNISHLTLGMLLHYLGKLKIQVFCRYSANIKNANTLHFKFLTASNFVIHPQILIFSVFKIATIGLLIANKIFHVTVLFTFAINLWHWKLEICHGRRHCSVCQQSTWYSATRTRFL